MIDKKTWDALSSQEKRVALAQDVLLQLEAGKIVPIPEGVSSSFCIIAKLPREDDGSYVARCRPWTINVEPGSGKELLEDPSTVCEVCGKGAFVVTFVLNFNSFPARNTASGWGIDFAQNPALVEIFGEKEWGAIESVYESWHRPRSFKTKEAWEATSRLNRMKFIMEFIIEKNGADNCIHDNITKASSKMEA